MCRVRASGREADHRWSASRLPVRSLHHCQSARGACDSSRACCAARRAGHADRRGQGGDCAARARAPQAAGAAEAGEAGAHAPGRQRRRGRRRGAPTCAAHAAQPVLAFEARRVLGMNSARGSPRRLVYNGIASMARARPLDRPALLRKVLAMGWDSGCARSCGHIRQPLTRPCGARAGGARAQAAAVPAEAGGGVPALCAGRRGQGEEEVRARPPARAPRSGRARRPGHRAGWTSKALASGEPPSGF